MTKKLNVAVQMDPLEDLTLAGDSTFVIALEAQKRNFNLFHYTPNDLVYKSGELYARMKRLSLSYHNKVESFDYGKETLVETGVTSTDALAISAQESYYILIPCYLIIFIFAVSAKRLRN